MEIAFAYVHFLSIAVIAACLAAEFTLLGNRDGRPAVESLGRIDFIYFTALGLMALTGMARVLASQKGMVYFAGNPVFWLKVLLVGAVAGLSLFPTLRYSKWRHQARMDSSFRIPAEAVKPTRAFVAAEAGVVALVLLMAVLMSRGVGTPS